MFHVFCVVFPTVVRHDGQFNFSLLAPRNPYYPPPFSTPSLCFLVPKCLNQLHSLDVRILRSKNSMEQKVALTFAVFLQTFVGG